MVEPDHQPDQNKYISVKEAASLAGYSTDYVTRLIRDKKIDAVRRDGRTWLVNVESIKLNSLANKAEKERRQKQLRQERLEEKKIHEARKAGVRQRSAIVPRHFPVLLQSLSVFALMWVFIGSFFAIETGRFSHSLEGVYAHSADIVGATARAYGRFAVVSGAESHQASVAEAVGRIVCDHFDGVVGAVLGVCVREPSGSFVATDTALMGSTEERTTTPTTQSATGIRYVSSWEFEGHLRSITSVFQSLNPVLAALTHDGLTLESFRRDIKILQTDVEQVSSRSSRQSEYDRGELVDAIADVTHDATLTGETTVAGALRDATDSSGSSGYILQSTGTSTRWVATSTLGIEAPGGSGITTLNGEIGVTQSFATSSSGGLAFDIASNSNTHSFTLGLTSGYTIPLTASTTNWQTAYGWGDHSAQGYLTDITGESLEDLSDVANMAQASGDLLYWNGSAWSNIATSSLGISGGGGAVDSVNGETGVVVLDTGDISENGNLYFTDARARNVLSSTAAGLSYATSTGVFSLTSGYTIPLTASTTEWAIAYGWGDHSSAGYLTEIATTTVRNLFAAGSGLSYSTTTGTYTNTGVTSIGGLTGAVATSSLGFVDTDTTYTAGTGLLLAGGEFTIDAIVLTTTGNLAGLASTTVARTNLGLGSLATLNSIDISDNTNLSISATGLELSGDALALTSGYTIPLTASTTNWQTAYSAVTGGGATFSAATSSILTVTGDITTGLSNGCVEVAGGVLTSTGSNCGTGSGGITSLNGQTNSSQTFATSTSGGLALDVGSAGGVHTFTIGLSSGYTIPLTASTTEWANKISSQWTTSGSDIYYNTGNVGIGTSTPSAKFAVTGTAGTGDIFAIASSTNARLLTVNSKGRLGIGVGNPAAMVDAQTSDTHFILDYLAGQFGYSAGSKVLLGTTDTGVPYIQTGHALEGAFTAPSTLALNPYFNNGGVGVGTTSSNGAALNVAGITKITGATTLSSTLGVTGHTTLTTASSTNLTVSGNSYLGTVTSGTWNGTAIDISDYTNLSISATGLELSGDALALTSGYTIPLTASTTNWQTAYGWGDHSAEGYLTGVAWGDITGTLANQTDLQNALNAKLSTTSAASTYLTIANNLSDLASASTARTNLGLGVLATLSSIDNSNWSGTDLSLANGGTGSSLTDPNADRIMFWDDSAGAVTWLTASTGLTLSGTNLTVRAASEAQTGIAEFATQAEVNAGTDTARTVRPSTLSGWIGSTNLAALGTITSGTWNGTDIDISDYTNLAVGNGVTLTGDTLTVTAAGGLAQTTGGLTTTGVLEDLNILGAAASDGQFIVATGAGTFAYESGATARTSLSLGSLATLSNLSTFDTDDLSEGTNQYFTDARARNALSSTATGLSYATSTGVFSLASGYTIPLTASTTAWQAFYTTPSGRITAGDGIEWSTNTLNVNDVTAAMLASSDFGDFTCNGTSCSFDADTVSSNEIDTTDNYDWAGAHTFSEAMTVGTTTASARLTVQASSTDSVLSLLTSAGTNLFTVPGETSGTSTLATHLSVGGDLTVSGATRLNGIAYSWPGSDGSDGQVLTTDGAGSLSWAASSGSSGANAGNPSFVFASSTAGSNVEVNFDGGQGAAPSFSNGVLTLPSDTETIIVETWGAGGGGSGGNDGGSGGTGGATCFGTNGTACTTPMLQATGGTGGPGSNPANGGTGGVGSGGDLNITGSAGGGSLYAVSTASGFGSGGAGGVAPRGTGNVTSGSYNTAGGTGGAFGGGGQGGGISGSANSYFAGRGGGGGGYSQEIVRSPSGSYYYTIGSGGAGGTAGSGSGTGYAGGAGGDGGIVITVYTSSGSGSSSSGIASSSVAFSVHRNGSNQTISTGSYEPIDWTTESFDTNNNFDLSTERFTPTIAGKYVLTANAYCLSGTSCYVSINKNGEAVSRTGVESSGTVAAGTVVVDMNGTTDYATVSAYAATNGTIYGQESYTNFSGALIAPSNGLAGGWSNDENQSYVADATDKVAIGSSTATAKLDVTGTSGSTDDLFGIASSTGSRFLTVTSSGNVGIGTTTPASTLVVAGDGTLTGNLDVTSNLTITGTTTLATTTSSKLTVTGETLLATALGNVGIGTTSPSSKLSVYGDVLVEGSSRYLNFGTATGTSGYGIRDNAGTLEWKNSGGDWAEFGTGSGSGGANAGNPSFVYASSTAGSNVEVNFDGGQGAAPSFSNGVLTLPSDTETIIVETWGAGGGGGGSANGGQGGTGGTSCFGTNSTACTTPLVAATGGVGGASSRGGAGGVGNAGDIQIAGGGGAGTSLSSATGGGHWSGSGAGGSAPRGGGGGNGVDYNSTGAAGKAFGGGGSGAGMNNVSQGGNYAAGPGGGGGGYAQKIIASPSDAYYYTIGAGGTGGTAGSTGGTGYAGGAGGSGGIVITVYTSSGSGSSSSGIASSSVAFSVHKNDTNQTITSDTWNKITWTHEDFDTNNNFDLSTERFTPTVAGKYIVTGGARTDDNTSYFTVAIFKNGSELIEGTLTPNAASITSKVSTVVDMNGTTDYLELHVYNSGGTNVRGEQRYTHFSGALLAPSNGLAGGWSNDATQSYLADSTDKVAIGTSTADAKVTIQGQSGSTDDLLGIASSTGDRLFTFTSTGRLGIGTTTPASAFVVTGDGSLTGNLDVTSNLTITGTTTLATTTASKLTVTGSTLLATLTGNVGIGTSSPSSKLTVNGDVLVEGSSRYLNFGTATGTSGYGIRDNSGTLEWKNSGGDWAEFGTGSGSGGGASAGNPSFIFASSTAGSNVSVNFNGSQGAAPSYSGGVLTLPSDTETVVVEVWGGGASGGRSASGGGGGGAGGYSQEIIGAPSGTYYYTIGSGGAGVGTTANGNAGGQSCFGTNATACTSPLLSASGGSGGSDGGTGGGGGSGSGGDLNLSGDDGGVRSGTGGFGGQGGKAPRGGGGGRGSSSSPTDGEVFGGGGGGADTSSGGSGAGGAGGVVITVYTQSGGTANGVASSSVAFSVHNNGVGQTVTNGAYDNLTWTHEDFDTNNNFDLDTDRFTPTVAGRYIITTTADCTDDTGGCWVTIRKNGAEVAESGGANTQHYAAVSKVIDMNGVTDYVEAYVYNSGGINVNGSASQTNFSGALIAPSNGLAGGWSNDGTQSYLADYTDLVAIGTTTAAAKLDIWGNAGSDDILGISSSTGSRLLTVTAAGNVGIGTTTPDTLLSVFGSTNGGVLAKINNPNTGASAFAGVQATSDGGSGYFYRTSNAYSSLSGLIQDDLIIQDAGGGDLQFIMGSAVKMTLTNAGNVGIGTTTPSALLTLGADSGGDSSIELNRNANTDYTSLIYKTGGTNDWIAGLRATSDSNFHIYSYGTASDALTILRSSGNVGIGATNPGQSLEVAGSAYLSANLYVGQGGSTHPVGDNVTGTFIHNAGYISVNRSGGYSAYFGRTNDGAVVAISSAGTAEGSISVSGSTVSYNAFTGSHYATTDETIERGILVALTGDNQYAHGRDSGEPVYGVTANTTENSPSILGSMLDLQEPSQEHDTENPYLIQAVGNGEMWVVQGEENTLETGDYLVSSAVPGYAKKDPASYPISNIIGKVTDPIDWSTITDTVTTGSTTLKKAFVHVTFEQFAYANPIAQFADEEDETGFVKALTEKLIAWFADAQNGIRDMFAQTFHAEDMVCIGETCVTENDLKAMLQSAGKQGTHYSAPHDETPEPEPPAPDVDTQDPVDPQVPVDDLDEDSANGPDGQADDDADDDSEVDASDDLSSNDSDRTSSDSGTDNDLEEDSGIDGGTVTAQSDGVGDEDASNAGSDGGTSGDEAEESGSDADSVGDEVSEE